MADGTAPGKPSPIGVEQQAWLKEKLAEERIWIAGALAEALSQHFGLPASRESGLPQELAPNTQYNGLGGTGYIPLHTMQRDGGNRDGGAFGATHAQSWY